MWVLFLIFSFPLCRGFDQLFEGDMAVPRSRDGQTAPGAFILSPSKLWSGGFVPYSFETLTLTNGEEEPIFSAEVMQLIQKAMNHISKMVPCIKFRQVSNDFSRAHLIFSTMGDAYNDPSGCWAYVGCQGAQGNKTGQTVNLGSSGCFNLGIVLHEIMHSLGATHEQNREDRSEYVRIIEENIMQDKKRNFEKKGALFSSYRTPYDYASIMHYASDAFSKSGASTIIPLQPNILLVKTSSKSSLSPIDVMELARVYEPVSQENCYTTNSLMSYIQNLEDLLAYENQSSLRTKGIIIAGGYEGTGKSVELFLPDTGKTCYLASFPEDRFYFTMDNLDNTVIACGGNNTPRSCIQFSPASAKGTWAPHSTTQKSRFQHTSWVSPSGLMLLSGRGSPTSSEFLSGGSNFTLPGISGMICGIEDEDSIILTGGYYSKLAARYNLQGKVEDLPDLRQNRWSHGCGSYKSGDCKIFVVAGGYTGSVRLSSSEILSCRSCSWMPGEALPWAIDRLTSISLDNAILLFGGYSTRKHAEIMSYNGTWSQIGTLQTARDHAASSKIYNLGQLDISGCK